MKILSAQVMDESGTVLIPEKLRSKINWEINDPLTALVNLADKSITLSKNQDGEFMLDALSRITLQKEIREEFGWDAYDKIAVILSIKDGTIKLSMYEKFTPKCVFCEKPESALIINGTGICKEHVSIIVNSGHK